MNRWTYWGEGEIGPVTIIPDSHEDDRGVFTVTLPVQELVDKLPGMPARGFQQLNTIETRIGVIRGLHVDMTGQQGKLVWAADGRHLSVAVDVREDSPMRGKWAMAELTSWGYEQFWVPPGFAHGTVCLSLGGVLQYASTTRYSPENERGLSPLAISMPWPARADFSTLRPQDTRVASIDQLWEEWHEQNSGGVPAS